MSRILIYFAEKLKLLLTKLFLGDIIIIKPMRKSSKSIPFSTESRGWCEHGEYN